ncbi:unannotated protein [freshwater metagenome]|uniref:Unannotated protein n=1 Tax=freshwater metagenome TaxID=449393 RepID=A0A6J6JB40_9ZZZZ
MPIGDSLGNLLADMRIIEVRASITNVLSKASPNGKAVRLIGSNPIARPIRINPIGKGFFLTANLAS